MKKSGIEKAAKDAGAEVIAFEDYDWVEVELPGKIYKERLCHRVVIQGRRYY